MTNIKQRFRERIVLGQRRRIGEGLYRLDDRAGDLDGCDLPRARMPIQECFIVFAAVPFGMVGALAALWIMGAPFGFMAFGGIVSLVGVIVSHIIVLFDFIEENMPRASR